MGAGFALLAGADGPECRELAEAALESPDAIPSMRVALDQVAEVEGALAQALGHTVEAVDAGTGRAPMLGQTATPVKPGKTPAKPAAAKTRTGQAQNPQFEKQHPRTAKGRTGGGTWITKKGAGMNGQPDDVVRQAQQRLTQLGYKVSPDGRFGPVTEEAIKTFQKATGLEPTGTIDEATAETMRNPPMEGGKPAHGLRSPGRGEGCG